MPKAKSRKRNPEASVRAQVRSEINEALKAMTAGSQSDEAIHTARKHIKRARAGLRLLRPSLGPELYARENAALRDAARPLTGVRDAVVLSQTLAQVLRRRGTKANGSMDALRTRLIEEKNAARRKLLGSRAELKLAQKKLLSVGRRTTQWPRYSRGTSGLVAGLQRVYRQGRKAFAQAQQDTSVEQLHEWRKQVKYLSNGLQIFRKVAPNLGAAAEANAHKLGECLGDDHDLALLREKVNGSGKLLDDKSRTPLTASVDARRAKLIDKTFRLGNKLYGKKPKRFAKGLQ